MAPSKQLHDEQDSIQFYEDRYRQGYMEEWPSWKRGRILEIVRELDLPETGRVLDFGCGNGVFTEVLCEALPRWEMFGVDVSQVAVDNARRNVPQCTFFHSEDPEIANQRFDFIFTHHVLEHVYDLDAAWEAIMAFTNAESRMLHVLPCGNKGSLEYEICDLRTDGIDPALEHRFFFEDEGHVRRLTTEQVVSKAEHFGFRLAREYYAGQYYGAIDWLTGNGIRFVLSLCDLTKAKDAPSRKRLRHLRNLLLPTAVMRSAFRAFDKSKSPKRRSAKDWSFLIFGWPLLIPAVWAERCVTRRADREWDTMKFERYGGEMYLYFERPGE